LKVSSPLPVIITAPVLDEVVVTLLLPTVSVIRLKSPFSIIVSSPLPRFILLSVADAVVITLSLPPLVSKEPLDTFHTTLSLPSPNLAFIFTPLNSIFKSVSSPSKTTSCSSNNY